MTSAPNRSTRLLEIPDEELSPGLVLADRYRVLEVIGHGGMGVVYLGEHVAVGRRLAIKILSQRWSRSPEIAGRFRAEARAATAAGHPNIVQVFDAGELPDGRLFLVMEYLQGRTVLEELNETGVMTPDRACRIGLHVARAIRAAHDRGVIHRDLKAENVMLVDYPDGEIVKVLDFGVAIGVDEAAKERLTRPGLVVGTPETMAPEQAQGREPTVKFDIYALGCLLFECLAGRPPFVADTPLLLVANKLKEEAPPISSLRPGLPVALQVLIDGCLRVDPQQRPASASDVCDALEAVVRELEAQPKLRLVHDSPAGSGEHRRPESLSESDFEPEALLRATRRRNQLFTVLAMVGAFAAIVALAWGTIDRADGSAAATVEHASSPVTIKSIVPPEETDDDGIVAASADAVVRSTGDKRGSAAPTSHRSTGVHRGARVRETPRSAARHRRSAKVSEATSAPSDSADCGRVRQAALDARRSHDWRGVLASTGRRQCWSTAPEWKKLRVQALKELKEFSKCAEEAKGMNDPEVQTWGTLCSRRAQVAPAMAPGAGSGSPGASPDGR